MRQSSLCNERVGEELWRGCVCGVEENFGQEVERFLFFLLRRESKKTQLPRDKRGDDDGDGDGELAGEKGLFKRLSAPPTEFQCV